MIKKIVLILMLSNSIYAGDSKPVVVWDLHGVVLTRSGTLSNVWAYPHTRQFFKNLSWPLLTALLVHLWTALFNKVSSESFIHLAEEYHNPELADLTIIISNAQEIMPGMDQVITSLEEENVPQYVGSNIGATAFKDLLDPKVHPKIAPLLERLHPEKSQVVEYVPGQPPLMKPDRAFFKAFLKRNCLDPQRRPIIFVDDREENIVAANEEGLVGIRFRNARQLQQALAQEGITIPVPENNTPHFETYQDVSQ